MCERVGPGGRVLRFPASQGRAANSGVAAGEGVCCAQQVVGDGGADDPGAVGAELSWRDVGQGAADEVSEHGLDDGVFAVGDVGDVDGFVVVGEERVMAPDREQCTGVVGIFDAVHDQQGGDRVFARFESRVGGFGYFGVGDPGLCVGVTHRAEVRDRCPPGVVDGFDGGYDFGVLVVTTENCAPARTQVRITAWVPYAESPRTMMVPVAPTWRAVVMAWATIRPAPLPDPVLPARNRSPAITGAAWSVLIGVASGERPLRRICLAAILV